MTSPSDERTLRAAPPQFTVMCIDDNVLLMDALERRLELEPEFAGMHRISDFSRSVEGAVAHRPTIVLLDIDLPNGVDAMVILHDLVRETPDARVIVFTGYPSGELVARSMSRGAWGFVSKGVAAERLIASILRVVAGEAVIEMED